jgi:putative transposase
MFCSQAFEVGEGGPLAVMTAPANWHDAVCLEDLLYSLVVERPEVPQHLCLDKGYDNPTGHRTVAQFDYLPHIRSIREEQPRSAGRRKARRWVVERTLAWLRKCRAILCATTNTPATISDCYHWPVH